VIGLTCTRPLLSLLNTPVEIIDKAAVYLMIIFGGTIGNLFFNLGSGILRGMGDSRWPLYAIIFSTVLNIALDALFSIVWGWGVAGVALATIICQFSSGIILLLRINSGRYSMKISLAQVLKPDGFIAKNIFRLGMPSGLQGVAMSIGGLIMQGFGNNFGAEFVTANAVIQRVDGFAIMPLMGLGMATTTFTGQNIGAGNIKRAQRSVYVALGTILSISVVMGFIMWFAGAPIIRLFNVSDRVLEMGLRGIRWICFFYAFMGIDNAVAGAMRGAGAAIRPVVNSFITQGCRLILTYLLAVVPLNRAIRAAVNAGSYATFELAKAAGEGLENYISVYYVMSIGMVLGAVLNFLYFKFGKWQDKGLMQRREHPVQADSLKAEPLQDS
jgi:putative MATE family efflux protein